MNKFSDRLSQSMSQSNFTQTSLSKKCGSIAQTTLSGYIRGLHVPSDENMKILAEALGVEYEWLKDGKKAKSRPSAAKERSTASVAKGKSTPPVKGEIQTHSLFSSRLKQAMEEKGLTQGALYRSCLSLCGDRISISRNAIGTYVRGDRNPTDEKIHFLADALGVEYEWLMGEETFTESSVGEISSVTGSEATSTEPSTEETSSVTGSEATSTEPSVRTITLTLQYGTDEMNITDLKERCRSAWRDQFGDGMIRSMAVYIKPEDHKAYWVVNGGQSGAVGI